ncbi:class V lanthionine synthetase subunit LxmK [Arthrobacter sp. M2012083]|uniref:class V lanthionine synthetase subunit LxmK n=1 Tax=Arthrobacter sp. M2012083 TaxID=1197706 RepID=UPI0005CBF9ED|nr:class V lanthionine synthetase subunit LxmK [Arthrobacter sp. M2012083]
MATQAKPLEQAEGLVDLIRDLGLGEFRPGTLVSPVGRNDSWVGETSTGRRVFAKQLLGPKESVDQRFSRIASFERHQAASTYIHLRSPHLLGADSDRGQVVFEALGDGESLAAQVIQGTGDPQRSREVGSAIGELHASEAWGAVHYDTSKPDLPQTVHFNEFPLDRYLNSTWGELQVVKLHQDDTAFAAAVKHLLIEEEKSPRVPSHCDLRLDQVMISDNQIHILDWEEFRLADPARDIGSYAGEWVYRAIMDIVRADQSAPNIELHLDHDLIIERGVAKLLELRPHIAEFWSGYSAKSAFADDETAVRATGFAGWHLHDRLLASSQFRSTLPPIERAAAGIGRSMVLQPEKFAAVLGLGGETA